MPSNEEGITTQDLAGYLANLTFIMDFHEKLGTTRNAYIVAEFTLVHDQLTSQLEKEHEARKRNEQHKRDEGGA